ncbi:MAG: transglutaminase-like cysteine peptidase [Gammaproteobacteria bacterium]
MAVTLTGLLCTALGRVVDESQMVEALVDRFGSERLAVLRRWRDLVAGAAGLAEREKLAAVNDFFNRHTRFSDDRLIWGEDDYWATPIETIGRAEGDCEDFSVAKYFTLRELGVPAERLRLTYVRARIGGAQSPVSQAHMVVSYYPTPGSEPLVLDNLIGSIRPASERPDLVPVFSFDLNGIYIGGAKQAGSSLARLSRWRSLLLRMREQGYQP